MSKLHGLVLALIAAIAVPGVGFAENVTLIDETGIDHHSSGAFENTGALYFLGQVTTGAGTLEISYEYTYAALSNGRVAYIYTYADNTLVDTLSFQTPMGSWATRTFTVKSGANPVIKFYFKNGDFQIGMRNLIIKYIDETTTTTTVPETTTTTTTTTLQSLLCSDLNFKCGVCITENGLSIVECPPETTTLSTTTTTTITSTTLGNATNQTTTTTTTISGCPKSCRGCSEWGECENGQEMKTCKSCGAETGYTCKSRTEKRVCTTSFDAITEIQIAKNVIERARSEGKNVSEAGALFKEAQDSMEQSLWAEAKEYATQAKLSAESAPVVDELKVEAEKKLPEIQLFVGIIVVLGIVLGYYVYMNEKNRKAEKKPEKTPEPEKICHVCNKNIVYAYTCSKCKNTVDFSHSRTYKKKTYCTDCLKKEGVI